VVVVGVHGRAAAGFSDVAGAGRSGVEAGRGVWGLSSAARGVDSVDAGEKSIQSVRVELGYRWESLLRERVELNRPGIDCRRDARSCVMLSRSLSARASSDARGPNFSVTPADRAGQRPSDQLLAQIVVTYMSTR
jgi:hypothetical protein